MWTYLLIALGVSLVINISLFLVAFRRKTDKLTDASYAISFIALGFYALAMGPLTPYRFMLFAIVAVWAVRLGGFLLFRIWQTGKDGRFDQMRGSFWKFGKFWVSQGLSVWVILIPTLLALRYEHAQLSLQALIGLLVWASGVAIEATADIQKYTFSTNPANKNKWIDQGIWHYSRHPNYFGEICVWAGTYLFAASVLSGAESIVGIVSPLFIAALLLFVSGIPILEKSADARWGKQAAYKAYKKRTSILIPLPPKRLT
jgi:steroid 5-alpha reductase family enzyme